MTDQNPESVIALDDHRNDFRDNALVTLVSKYLKKGSVLDVGCGTGWYMHEFSKIGFKTYGIEPNEQMIAKSRELFGKLNIRKGIAEKMQGSFDNIVMLDVLEHIRDDGLVLSNCYECLNAGGRLVLIVPAYQWLWGRRDEIFRHYRRYDKGELEWLLETRGFKIIVSRYWNFGLLLPYFFLRNLKKEERYISFRKKGNRLISWWFRNVENRFNLWFGINIIVVVEK